MISVRCWLFGHVWGAWFELPDDDYPYHKDPEESDIRSSKCTRCGIRGFQERLVVERSDDTNETIQPD